MGVLTQGDKSGDVSLFDMVKDYLKEKHDKPGNVFLGLVHRLDKPVQGIILFGKTSKGASRLSEQFRNHTIQKTYHGIVIGKPKQEKAVKKATKTRTAELSYEVIRKNDKYSLLRILPKTGRFHQIRIQMQQMGCPILGDTKYGAREPLHDKSIALAATAISFKSATDGKEINLEISLPESWQKIV